ncbi:MAG TPA: DUF4325 domain-containing protein [Planctomycetota bacterium]|nr:DUF4325 domain-containing protein [Planctomycetota bacterium]HRR82323.1 DUF4325 domain-containing protein [Planctomycetota bacterium]HRT95449.1 DUF4325 domain-containing protein [Planctomycetota bacterium]
MAQAQTKAIRSFIISNVAEHPRDIARVTAERFDITRQSVARHLRDLVGRGILEAIGRTRSRVYRLKELVCLSRAFPIAPGVSEDRVWREQVAPALTSAPAEAVAVLPGNVLAICQHGFSEIFNNALEHSEGTTCHVTVTLAGDAVGIAIWDNGVGIFRKIKEKLGLDDERHAILELAKGKLTTDPHGHTGEGIFFTIRMFDEFSILSGGLFFGHMEPDDDWLLESRGSDGGTLVSMTISTRSTRTIKEVFDRFARDPAGYDFSRTHVPVELLRYGQENLISRSQARRLVARFGRFREVMLDFRGVPMIGQAFADEIFRVFHREQPAVHLVWSNTTPDVEAMIHRALSAYEEERAATSPPASQ